MLKKNRMPELYFLLVVLSGLSIVVFFVFRPFLFALILAMVFASAFYPFYKKLVTIFWGMESLAALVTLLCGVVLVLTPLIFLGVQIFKEAQQVYGVLLVNGGHEVIKKIVDWKVYSQACFPVLNEITFDVDASVKQAFNWILQHLGDIFGSFGKLVLSFFVFLISFFFLLKDGGKLKAAVIQVSPLSDADHDLVFQTLARAIDSVLKGGLLVAVIQGGLALFGMTIFGVPNSILWASVTAVSALIPGVGTSLILIPTTLYLFIFGNTVSGVGLGIWSVFVVGVVDNFLGPKLIGQVMQLHPLMILLSVLGGIGLFGPIGFLLGPLLMSLFFAFLKIYFTLRVSS
ncbi:MAG: AI-2E family transporter [Candidatus Margulisbacteria bacterium]|nr:AI-2E family transporter [Candidatus Margulisiibacteriota bacterium]